MLSFLVTVLIFGFCFLAFIFVAGLLLFCVLYLPYWVWLTNQNLKGKLLDLNDLPLKDTVKNALKWWKSLFTHKSAF